MKSACLMITKGALLTCLKVEKNIEIFLRLRVQSRNEVWYFSRTYGIYITKFVWRMFSPTLFAKNYITRVFPTVEMKFFLTRWTHFDERTHAFIIYFIRSAPFVISETIVSEKNSQTIGAFHDDRVILRTRGRYEATRTVASAHVFVYLRVPLVAVSAKKIASRGSR